MSKENEKGSLSSFFTAQNPSNDSMETPPNQEKSVSPADANDNDNVVEKSESQSEPTVSKMPENSASSEKNYEVLYVVDNSDPQSKPTSKRSSKLTLSQNFSNFSFYNRSSRLKKDPSKSRICRCQEKFDIVKQHSFTPCSSSSSESVSSRHCTDCRCVNCPLKQVCWFITFLSSFLSLTCCFFLLLLQMIQLSMKWLQLQKLLLIKDFYQREFIRDRADRILSKIHQG